MAEEGIEIPITAIDEFSQVYNKADQANAELMASSEEQIDVQKRMAAQNEETQFSWTELRSAYSVAVEVFQAGKQVFDATFGAFQDYAQDVRDLSIATGTGAEEASTLLQVLDDFQISADSAQTAARALKEKGLSPTVDTLAELSDQFLAIEDPAKRLDFAQQNLGRSYKDYLNLLSQGSAKIRENADAVNKNLILTDQQIKDAEKERLALDALSDSWQGLKVQVGAFLGEEILANQSRRDYIELTGEAAMVNGVLTEEYIAYNAQLERGAAMTELYNEQMAEQVEITEEDTEAIKAVSDANEAMLQSMSDFQGIADTYNEKTGELEEKQNELLAEKQKLIEQGYSEEGEKISEINQKLAENIQAQQDATEAARIALKEKVAAMVEAQLATGGTTAEEFDAIIALRENFGLLSADAAEGTRQVYDSVQNYMQTGDLDAFSSSITGISDSLLALPEEKSLVLNVDINATSNGQALTPEQLQFILTHLSI
jgi:hypothetical protein